jgi:4'-phosphopantetheinyl transferase
MQAVGVEVWTARPRELGAAACGELAAVLDQEERERALHLRFETDRHAFVVSHAMRRIALGLALATDPHDLRFAKGPHGQPILLDARAGALSFSLSRSRELVAFALCAGGPVGIDVETVQDGVDAALLAPYMDLRGAGEPIGIDEFYMRWTALEAFWKARGLGLSRAHPRIALHEAGESGQEVRIGDDSQPTGLYAVRLPAASTHVLSVVCREVSSIKIIELDRLARTPANEPQMQRGDDQDANCLTAGAPDILNT